MKRELTFLGSGDSKGVPRFWCPCPVCAEARSGGVNRRTRTGLLLRVGPKVALLDASADLHAQLARLPGPLVPGAVLISHAHNDHLLGLGDLLDYVRYARGQLRVYAPAGVLPQIRDRFTYAFRTGDPVQALPDAGVPVGDLTIRAFEVPHGANGTSWAYRLDRPGWAGVIMTDALDVPEPAARRWLSDLDLLVLGTAFTDEQEAARERRSVYDVHEARQLPWAQQARQVILTHLSHGVDTRCVPLPPGWRFAHDGQSVPLT